MVAPFSGNAFVPYNGHGHYMVLWWLLNGHHSISMITQACCAGLFIVLT